MPHPDMLEFLETLRHGFGFHLSDARQKRVDAQWQVDILSQCSPRAIIPALQPFRDDGEDSPHACLCAPPSAAWPDTDCGSHDVRCLSAPAPMAYTHECSSEASTRLSRVVSGNLMTARSNRKGDDFPAPAVQDVRLHARGN